MCEILLEPSEFTYKTKQFIKTIDQNNWSKFVHYSNTPPLFGHRQWNISLTISRGCNAHAPNDYRTMVNWAMSSACEDLNCSPWNIAVWSVISLLAKILFRVTPHSTFLIFSNIPTLKSPVAMNSDLSSRLHTHLLDTIFFSCSVFKPWNSLPATVVKCGSAKSFKRSLSSADLSIFLNIPCITKLQ